MKKFTKCIALLTAILTLAGCTEKKTLLPEDGSTSLVSENKNGAVSVKTEPLKLTESGVENSILLFDRISEGKEQSMFSPLSLDMALGLVQSGTSGETKTEIDAYLGTDNYANYAESYMKTVRDKYNSESHGGKYENVFEIGNSFWANKDIKFNDEYKNGISDKFGAMIENADFSDKEKTLKAVNQWCAEKTHKMIPEILSDYDENSAAFLINTVYFESGWSKEWNVYSDSKETFTKADGSAVDIPFMYNNLGTYFDNGKAEAFSAHYRNGLEFIGILPKSEGDFTLESLDIPTLLENRTVEYDVEAKMPRLNFESEFPLNDALKAAGIKQMFYSDKADFSVMSGEPLYISDTLQKTKLELDEYGARAAAATALIAAAGAYVKKETREVCLDRPFAFLIYDPNEEQIIFIGKVLAV